MRDLIRAAGARYEDCRLSNFQRWGTTEEQIQQDRVLTALRIFAERIVENVARGRNLVLAGPRGTGKDHLLFAMARAVIKSVPGASVTWVSGMDLFAEMRDAIDSKERTERAEVNRWVRANEPNNVLCISDPLPPHSTTDAKQADLSSFQRQFLYRIIDGRYRVRKPTWVSINVSNSEDAARLLTPQIHDRLRDGALTCGCKWQSYRQTRTESV